MRSSGAAIAAPLAFSLGGYAGRRAHIPRRGLSPGGRLDRHAEALGREEGGPGAPRPLDARGRRTGAGGGADARARPLAGGPEAGGTRGPSRIRLRRGTLPQARRPALRGGG